MVDDDCLKLSEVSGIGLVEREQVEAQRKLFPGELPGTKTANEGSFLLANPGLIPGMAVSAFPLPLYCKLRLTSLGC